MRYDTTPQFLAMYRERSAQAPIVLRRRRCDCGAPITEKQQRVYGCCEKCWEKK